MASGGATISEPTPDVFEHNTSEGSPASEYPTGLPVIKFARFKNATLELFNAPIESTDYIAFSHVWGEWTWRSIPGIPYEVKASQEKAQFIANDLPALVGDGAFWMDTLTVDQRNPVEISEIVDAIPDIFRMAKKTIAVRECDGLYDCCIAALAGFETYQDFIGRFIEHGEVHIHHLCAESYLQRLWTLQECLLSHTIDFVVGNDNQPKKPAVREQACIDLELYRHFTNEVTLGTALLNLANSFCGSQGGSARDEFIKAYVHGGTVVNPHSAKRRLDEDIHSGHFLPENRYSQRSATMPRDYIFATMPSFPWYRYPKKDALSMSFGEIYSDLYQQAERSGHAFTCRFTRSMLDPKCTDLTDDWRPSQHVPSPTTLGDFLKLMGQRVPEASNASSPHVHITSDVLLEELESECSLDIVLAWVEACFKYCREQWTRSHQGGELSKFGNDPDHLWELNPVDAMSCGWLPIEPEDTLRVSDSGVLFQTSSAPGLDFMEHESIADLSHLDETEHEARMYEAGDYVPLFVQARKILDLRWFSYELHSVWEDFKQQMQGLWSKPLLHTMLLVTGMVNCRIPLSAAAWVNKLFVPVYIHHSVDLHSIGLLAKHARQPKSQRQDPLCLLCVGQHLPSAGRKAFGQDLFLVDPETKVPVGLYPDMSPDYRTDEELAKVALSLYDGCCTELGDNKVAITPCLLSDELSAPRETYIVGPQGA